MLLKGSENFYEKKWALRRMVQVREVMKHKVDRKVRSSMIMNNPNWIASWVASGECARAKVGRKVKIPLKCPKIRCGDLALIWFDNEKRIA